MDTVRTARNGAAMLLLAGLVLTLIGLLGVVAAGCSDSEAPASADTAQTQTYTVRGRVVKLPSGPVDAGEVTLHHEAIPDFVGKDGVASGMKSMIMPFPAGPGIRFEGLEPNDVVEIDFAVNWSRKPHYYITRIEPLPADTTLDLN